MNASLNDSESIGAFFNPIHLWSGEEVVNRIAPVPDEPGVYAWYFRDFPNLIPTEGCAQKEDVTLLYVGVAPKKPPTNGKKPSSQTIRKRIRKHLTGDAEGSTLRLSIGSLLAAQLGIELRMTGRSGTTMGFVSDGTKSKGEKRLSDWMRLNAFVTWQVSEKPWLLEDQLIGRLNLPLNLSQNLSHSFHATLSQARARAKERAKSLPSV